MKKELKTLKDMRCWNVSMVKEEKIELKAEAVKRAKHYMKKALKFLGKKEINDYGNYCYFKGKYEAEVFAHNLTEEDLE